MFTGTNLTVNKKVKYASEYKERRGLFFYLYDSLFSVVL